MKKTCILATWYASQWYICAFTGVLDCLGIDLGSKLMEASIDNPEQGILKI